MARERNEGRMTGGGRLIFLSSLERMLMNKVEWFSQIREVLEAEELFAAMVAMQRRVLSLFYW